MQALATPQTTDGADIRSKSKCGGRIVRIQDVDTTPSIFLSTSVGREDLNGVVDSRGCNGRFIRVACKSTVGLNTLKRATDIPMVGEILTLHNIDYFTITLEDVD